MDKLTQLRKKIDKIDKKLSGLLRERAEKMIKIKELKKLQKLPVIDPNREQEILKGLKSDYEKNIFKQILIESRKLQKNPSGHLKNNTASDII